MNPLECLLYLFARRIGIAEVIFNPPSRDKLPFPSLTTGISPTLIILRIWLGSSPNSPVLSLYATFHVFLFLAPIVVGVDING